MAITAFFESGARVGVPLVALTFCTATAAWVRLGWLVPSLILGAAVGQLLDPAVKSGEIYFQRLETLQYIAEGALTGLLFGVLLDVSAWAARRHPGTNATAPEPP
jgi:hypothetical protein